MKRLLSCATAVILLLSGCTGDRYTQKDAQAREAQGLEILYAAFAQAGEPVTVVTSNALEDFVAGGPHYLSEFMGGQYRDDDGLWEYRVNTVTGAVYTSRHYSELEELVKERLARKMELGEGAYIEEVKLIITLPHDEEHPGSWGNAWTGPLLPLGADAETWLADAGDRAPIVISSCTLFLPEGMDYTYPEFSQEEGLSLWQVIRHGSDAEE